jgi:hypothetical protein
MILIIGSKHYLEQNANDLTIYLDEELSNIESMQLVYAGIPCTFYIITSEIGNNMFGIQDPVNWKYYNSRRALWFKKFQ